MKKYINTIIAIVLGLGLGLYPLVGKAQQYTGISGLIHIPSAEMHHEGEKIQHL